MALINLCVTVQSPSTQKSAVMEVRLDGSLIPCGRSGPVTRLSPDRVGAVENFRSEINHCHAIVIRRSRQIYQLASSRIACGPDRWLEFGASTAGWIVKSDG